MITFGWRFSHGAKAINEWAKLKEQEIQAKKDAVAERIHQMDIKLKNEFQAVEKNLIEQSERVEQMVRSLRKEAKRI